MKKMPLYPRKLVWLSILLSFALMVSSVPAFALNHSVADESEPLNTVGTLDQTSVEGVTEGGPLTVETPRAVGESSEIINGTSDDAPEADDPANPSTAPPGDSVALAGPAAPTPYSTDVTNKVSLESIKLQQKVGDAWQDIAAGAQLPHNTYVRIYINWSILDMTDVNAGDTFTFTIDPKDHLRSSNHSAVDLIGQDGLTVIGSYVVNGNLDGNGDIIPGQPITIVTTLSEKGVQYPSLDNGFFSLEGYVTGEGSNIEFTVNGTALPSINVDPPVTHPLYGTPLEKFGMQVAGENQINWSLFVNRDNVVNAYKNYAAGVSQASPQQHNLLLTDELQGGQTISSSNVTVYMPVHTTTDSGTAQTDLVAKHSLASLFDHVDKGPADGMTQETFRDSVRFASQPTIGVWDSRVVYVGFGTVPTGGTSTLNIANVPGGESGLATLLDLDPGVTNTQKSIIMGYYSAVGPNKGDLTSFVVELLADASETGQYDNEATLTYGDASSENAKSGVHFTVVSGGVEVRDGKAVLTKVDAADPNVTLPGAVFKLEKMQPDNSWATVAGAENLASDANGLITVTGLLLGQYRFVELVPPTGYLMEGQPVEFAITSATPNHTVGVTATNAKSPVLGSVTLTKVDADDQGVTLPGAVFKLEERASDGTWTDVPGHEALATDADGLIEVRDLAMGTYRFVEVSAPEGYELATEPFPFTLTADTPNLAAAVTATNVKTPVLGGAILTKVDADTPTTVLAGATFKLEQRLGDGAWATVPGHEALTTGADGTVEVDGLSAGSYRFVETAAPEGYVLDATPVEFSVAAGQPAQVELAMKNAPVPPDPVDPVDPTDPTDPTDPGTPGKPSTTQPPAKGVDKISSSIAKMVSTGDAIPVAIMMTIAGAAAAALAGSLFAARRRARRR